MDAGPISGRLCFREKLNNGLYRGTFMFNR